MLPGGVSGLTRLEMSEISGHGPFGDFCRCVGATLTRGNGAIKTMFLGAGLFGVARILGVAVGCADL